MICPRCNRQANKRYKGYCSRVHYKLDHRPATKLKIPCKGCGALQIRAPSAVPKSGNVYCSQCRKPSGENHSRWREGQYINEYGYRIILKNGSYLREHRVVWEEANKACLLSGATIHHVDFDKLNNNPDNLLLLSPEEHGRLHRLVDNKRANEVESLILSCAGRQYHYPHGIHSFLDRMKQGYYAVPSKKDKDVARDKKDH